MLSLILKAAVVSIMWLVTGVSIAAAIWSKYDDDKNCFRRFLANSIWGGMLALIDTAFFVWSVYPG